MHGADDSLTSPAPKILEGNAIEIIEIDEWAPEDAEDTSFASHAPILAPSKNHCALQL